MKSAICLSSLVVLGILVISPTSGYESLYGRTFNLFSLLQSPQTQVKSLFQRYATLDAAFNFLTSQFSSLQSQITSLASQITALTTKVNALTQPRCPAVAGALIVNGVCLSVEGSENNLSTLKTFTAAQTACVMKGGYLAEPSTVDTAFWSNLKTKFPSQVAELPIKGMFVGITAPAVAAAAPPTYSYVSGATISNSASVWVPTTPVAPVMDGAAFALVSTTALTKWLNLPTATDLITAATEASNNKRGYICQYATVI